jgi:hypothetical protein
MSHLRQSLERSYLDQLSVLAPVWLQQPCAAGARARSAHPTAGGP